MNNTQQSTFLGHPKGLFLLFSTELWERFSYYAMRAILVLYLTDKTINGGLGWSTQDALKLYGLYTGLVYITPLIGGWLADNILGQRKAILIGGTLMALGQFTLALPHGLLSGSDLVTFYAGLGLLICGNGLFKP
ncbi:dipeptide/tripeptide permease, partial [Vibrio cholerae]|nr:dipeptide/tripeptide permease [Vibrio cholerae]